MVGERKRDKEEKFGRIAMNQCDQFLPFLTVCFVAVWPDLAIYLDLGNFLKLLATIQLPKSPAFLGNFCKGVKIFTFSSEIIFRQLL